MSEYDLTHIKLLTTCLYSLRNNQFFWPKQNYVIVEKHLSFFKQ